MRLWRTICNGTDAQSDYWQIALCWSAEKLRLAPSTTIQPEQLSPGCGGLEEVRT